jgi:hypothetical protein
VTVEPNADLTGQEKRPDFRCYKNGHKFYVETTCMSIGKAERKTAIPHEPTGEGQWFDVYGFSEAIAEKVGSKVPQCKDQDAPCIVAVGTFHSFACMTFFKPAVLAWLQTGKQSMSWKVNPRTGKIGGTYPTTDLKSALFLFGKDGRVVEARQPVSAVLVGALGLHPMQVVGFLNPAATRPFDSKLLDVPYCGLNPGYKSGALSVYWTQRPEWLFD